MSFRVRDVARLTGIPRGTLLAWERRYDVVTPERSANGYRVYSQQDIDRLKQVKQLVDDGRRVGDAIHLVDRGSLQSTSRLAEAPSGITPEARRVALLEALIAFDRTEAERIRLQLGAYTFRTLLADIYVPLLHDTGARWERGDISIAQEHYVTAFCREHLVHVLGQVGPEEGVGPRVVAAGYPGESHELGLLMAAIELSMGGCRVHYLGADLPQTEVARVAHHVDADLVCQSKIYRINERDLLQHSAKLLALLPPTTVLALGGAAVASMRHESSERVWFCGSVDELFQRWQDRWGSAAPPHSGGVS